MTYFTAIAILKVIVLILLVVFLFYRLNREKENAREPKNSSTPLAYLSSKRALLITLSFISVACFLNLGTFHGVDSHKPAFLHYWEMFHYYMGSKYFKELGYSELYNATVVVDAEDNSYLTDKDWIMDLRTYHLIPRVKVLEKAGYYKALFTSGRWKEFQYDVNFFKKTCFRDRFAAMLRDHGYNPSPLWNANGYILSNAVSVDKILFLGLLDTFLLIIMFSVIGFIFGLEIMLIALIFFSTDFISSFYWIGGSFLRYDWLVSLVMGLCMINKKRYKTAGVLLSYATMVRIFPILFMIGIGIKAISNFIATKKIPRKYINLFLAFILATVIFFAYSCLLGKGIESWKTFIHRIKVHNQTLLTNNVGYKMVFLYDPTWLNFKTFVSVYEKRGENPYILLSDVKRVEFDKRKPEFLLLAAMSLFLFFLLVKNKDDTEVFAWSGFLIFMALAPTCYYYSFMMMFPIILYKRKVTLGNTIFLALLFIVQIASFAIDFYEDFFLHIYYEVSFMLFTYFLLLVIYELYKNLRCRENSPIGD